jgi:hypothetical protein
MQKLFKFEERSLEALLHEDKVLFVQCLGAGDEGRSDAGHGLGNLVDLLPREPPLDHIDDPVKAFHV